MEYNNNMPTYSSSLEVILPSTLFDDGYELTNQTVIESADYQGSFIPGVNNCEFYIYDANKVLITSNYNFSGLTVPDNPNPKPSFDPRTGTTSYSTTEVNLNPEGDIVQEGFTFGKMYAVYNFINLELGSSMEVPYYLSEISSDRTEIRLKSNFITTRTMKSTSVGLKNTLANPDFFDEIYISFGNNEYHIGVNIKYDDTVGGIDNPTSAVKSNNAIGQSSILIKLYDALPLKYSLLDALYVCTKTAESQAYLVNFVNDFKDADDIIKLKGPNSNLKIQDFVNGASTPKNKKELLGTKSSGSKDQLLNVLDQTGVQLTPNYSTASFGEFINFSSAKSQVSNFVEKVARIQSYEADLNAISQTTGSNVGNIPISQSIASLFTKIEEEIVAFSGFDYYQYYATSSDTYPKTILSSSTFPFDLLPTQSNQAQTWITASEESGSLFDGDNQNWLYYTVPGFIKDNSSNDNYLEFVNMVGQSFDEVWLYTKAITERLNTTNDLESGVALQLADDVITSLGYTGFGNNYNNQDNFIGLIGSDNGNYLPPTGSELITHYIAVNGPGGVINYWEDGYSYEDYVESFKNLGFPYPIDKVSKEIFKRLYHNMSYLVKKKGSVAGLRQLINIWGIPNTILRINEFGGKNKDEEDDYDLWYQRYSYAYKPVAAGTNYASSSVRVPWQPLYRNYIHSHNKLVSTSTITATGTTLTGATPNTTTSYGVDTSFTVTGGGSGGTLTLTADGGGNITTVTLTQGDSNGYNEGSIITVTAAQVNALSSNLGTNVAGGPATFTITAANLGAEQIVPDGLGFRFKTTGYPSSSWGGTYDSQSLFIKKSTNTDTTADFGIILNYTGSTSGSHSGSTSSAYKDYGEMRFFINGSQLGGDTALSPPIYLPFFDKGWWNVQLQRDEHPIVSNDLRNTTYTLYVANKIYDGADGNQLGFQGSASIDVNVGNNDAINGPLKGSSTFLAASSSVNASWNAFSIDLAQYGAGGYLGGWGNTLTTGETGSMGILSNDGGSRTGLPKGIQNAGKNFSGSLQEFRYYSNDISQSVFNDAVMNPESIEGNFITGSESSFDIVNFRAPLGNELESRFTSSVTQSSIEQFTSLHPAITGSSPLVITASFYDPTAVPFLGGLTSSYDVTYNINSATRTFSEPNVETYFLDQPSIGIRNRVSNKIKYSTNLNFGTTLSNRVSIQQDPPISQSYTDNINSLEVAFSPTEEVNDDIIQSLGYGAIQEVIADPRFRSASNDSYPGLDAIAKDYFKKYTNRSQIDYLRLIKYFDDSLFKAIKNYVPARTSVSTGIVIKQNMLERSRYREPQLDIVTTQSYAPFNKALTAKNLEITGNIETNQLWDPLLQTTYYSASDVYNFNGGPGGSVNQYNILEEGGGLFILESDDLALTFKGVVNNANILAKGTGYTAGLQTLATTGGSGDGNLSLSVTANASGNITEINSIINAGKNYVVGDIVTIAGNAVVTPLQTNDATVTIDGVTLAKSLFESTPLEEVNKDLILVNAGPIQPQASAAILFGDNVDGTTSPSDSDAVQVNHSITIQTINPADGSIITKNYVTSDIADTGALSGTSNQFVRYRASGNGAAKAIQFADAVNSANGQGSGASTPTVRAVVVFTDQVKLTQLYGGVDGNTTITYGSKIINTFGKPAFFDNSTFTGGTSSSATGQNLVSTNLSGLTVNLTFSSNLITAVSVAGTINTSQAEVGDLVLITGVTNATGTPSAEILSVSSVTSTNPNFTGGLSAFSNTFLNALKSVQTPVYIDYDFVAAGFANTAVTIQASSSKRGVVMTNTTTYTTENPVGSILTASLFDIHPGEDMYMLISSVPDRVVEDYQLILGENLIITRGLAAQTTTASTTLLVDNLDPSDKTPVVGSVVTGPNIKAGVVTVLGAITAAGTGYTNGAAQILATTGAGGNNLTLNVTVVNGSLTTAAISGANNDGTGYTSGDIVTIVGGNNNAKVAITTASAITCIVTAFNPTNNQVTFNQNQSVTNNSKVTFTIPNAIPNADTVPVSQQGYFTNTTTSLGIDTSWDSFQEQFYNGEYSGSEINVESKVQYNPYRKVKANSIPIAEVNIALDSNDAPAAALKNSLVISNNTTNGIFNFNATAGSNNTYPLPVFYGITKEELIPYQTYRVQATVQLSAGFGSSVGIFYENYGYNDIEYNPYPGIVNLAAVLTNAGADYTVGGGYQTVATNPVIVAAGTGYTAGTFKTTGGNGAGQTVTITESGGVVATVTLVNPGSGYLRSDVLTIVGGNNNATINVGKGGVVVEITEVSAVGSITGITKIKIQNGGNGAYQKLDALTIIGGNNAAQFSINSPTSTAANGVSTLGTVRPISTEINIIDFIFRFLPPLSGDTSKKGRYGLSFYANDISAVGIFKDLVVTGIGGIYSNVEAPIFFDQQDQGYDNQADYQSMGNEDAQGNTISPLFLIQNTQSVIFNNSDYNPLSNNVNTNRSSSFRYVLSYGSTQSVPNNFDLVVTQSYFPTSPSGTFPERADVPDSNYTMPSSINARYNGTKLSSLDYNFFTPSGSIGPEVGLPIMPVNRVKSNFIVANEFLDGSFTSSFQQTPLGAGSASWQGDSKQYSGSATIDKHPIYMARFENSYEQLNLYNSYQFNIDQLIEVPMESIAGAEVTPNSITIDGSNENKKIVSSVFEPKRKLQVSYLNPKTPAIDYSTMQIGNYDILSGATEFLTINSNAKSRVSASLAYNYTRGGQLVTSSLTQDQGTIQMVTGSNRIGDPATEGQLDTTAKLAFVSGQVGATTYTSLTVAPLIPTGQNQSGVNPIAQIYPLQSMGGPGSGGSVNIVINTLGEVISSYSGDFTGDVVDAGSGYVQGQTVRVYIDQKGGTPIEIYFIISSTEILANPNSIVSNGFILSGSLTTGNIPPLRNTSLVVGTPLTFTGGASGGPTFTAGTIIVPAYSSYISISNPGQVIVTAQGSGAILAVTCDASAITKVNVVDGGSGYRPGDQLGVFAEDLNDVMRQGANGAIIKGLTSGFLTQQITELQLAGESSPFQLNFNPSAISSSLVTSSLGAGATSTLVQQLLIGGPQLALFNMFNTTVSSSLFDVNTIGSDLNEGPSSLLWTTSGSNPANPENYYNWAPEFSDCDSYTNTNTPFTIERGDIIRVEGTLNTITVANVSQSTNVIQDFTVEELQPFNYTSSFAEVYNFNYLKTTTLSDGNGITNIVRPSAPTGGATTYTGIAFPVMTTSGNGKGAVLTLFTGGTNPPGFNDFTFTSIGNGYKAGDVMSVNSTFLTGIPNFSFELTSDAFETPGGIQNTTGFQAIKDGAFTQTNTKGSISAIPTVYQGLNRKFVCVINTDNSGTGEKMNLSSNTTGSIKNVGGTVTAQIVCGSVAGANSNIREWSFTGGENIPEGTSFNIEDGNIKSNTTGWGTAATATAFQFEMLKGCIVQQQSSNNFTFGVDVAASAESTPESGSQEGFHNYKKDEIGFTAPSFVRVTPDPTETLVGLPAGEITKMTIRRQIEADDKVMVKNITPPSGSLGIETQSGQGFLIPNDFSPVQKANALNIINQLKAKNAFDKPNEPGITDSGLVNPSGLVNIPPGGTGSGGSGGGGLGGIN